MTFEEFETAYHRLFTQDPNRCVFLGVPERLGDLPDPSAEGLANQLAQADVLLGQVSQVDLTTLSFEQSLDIELARLSLQRFIFEANLRFNGRLDSAQWPTAGDDITNGIFFLFINDPRSPQERLDNILSRLKQVPEYLLKLCGRLDTPVQRWVEIELEKIEGGRVMSEELKKESIKSICCGKIQDYIEISS